jgi:hypothetical protein
MKKETFYSLSTEDIQTVATKEIGRKLSKKEIDAIVENISERIAWYDIIAACIGLKGYKSRKSTRKNRT